MPADKIAARPASHKAGLPVVKRQQLLEACRVCVEHDAHINEAEQTLLYTLAACLEIDGID